eukprot:scaffold292842_cov42-Prasinocladus_malaysianus.AAC.1
MRQWGEIEHLPGVQVSCATSPSLIPMTPARIIRRCNQADWGKKTPEHIAFAQQKITLRVFRSSGHDLSYLRPIL